MRIAGPTMGQRIRSLPVTVALIVVTTLPKFVLQMIKAIEARRHGTDEWERNYYQVSGSYGVL